MIPTPLLWTGCGHLHQLQLWLNAARDPSPPSDCLLAGLSEPEGTFWAAHSLWQELGSWDADTHLQEGCRLHFAAQCTVMLQFAFCSPARYQRGDLGMKPLCSQLLPPPAGRSEPLWHWRRTRFELTSQAGSSKHQPLLPFLGCSGLQHSAAMKPTQLLLATSADFSLALIPFL